MNYHMYAPYSPRLFFPLQRDELGALVSLEMGKIRTEGIGEVQEFVDIVSSNPSRAGTQFIDQPIVVVIRIGPITVETHISMHTV
jgi:hypothetical protein